MCSALGIFEGMIFKDWGLDPDFPGGGGGWNTPNIGGVLFPHFQIEFWGGPWVG